MTYRPVAVTLSVAAVLQVLTGCKCPDPITGDHDYQLYPTEEELAEILDEEGNLSEEACEAFCRDHVNGEVDEIYSCGIAEATTTETESSGETAHTGMQTDQVLIDCSFSGTVEVECIGGRHHAAIASRSDGHGHDPVIAWLQGTAHAEAASVKAFVTLAGELERLGAPSELIDGCRAAARDEVAHARMVGALAARRGTEVPSPRFADVGPRSLLDVALENAVEGCVREVWAAALAHWQATHAADPAIRRLMAPIARDEARHGDLARALHAWAMTQLSDEERQQVLTAREEAVDELLASLSEPSHPGLASLGLPEPDDAMRLGEAMAQQLWRDPAVA